MVGSLEDGRLERQAPYAAAVERAVSEFEQALVLCGETEMAGFYLERAMQAFGEWDMPWHRARAERELGGLSES